VALATITLEPNYLARLKYFGKFVVMFFLSWEYQEGLPFDIVIRDSRSDEILWSEGPFESTDAQMIEDRWIEHIENMGLDGFLFRKESGWKFH
jgi:hypothetical protein